MLNDIGAANCLTQENCWNVQTIESLSHGSTLHQLHVIKPKLLIAKMQWVVIKENILQEVMTKKCKKTKTETKKNKYIWLWVVKSGRLKE